MIEMWMIKSNTNVLFWPDVLFSHFIQHGNKDSKEMARELEPCWQLQIFSISSTRIISTSAMTTRTTSSLCGEIVGPITAYNPSKSSETIWLLVAWYKRQMHRSTQLDVHILGGRDLLIIDSSFFSYHVDISFLSLQTHIGTRERNTDLTISIVSLSL